MSIEDRVATLCRLLDLGAEGAVFFFTDVPPEVSPTWSDVVALLTLPVCSDGGAAATEAAAEARILAAVSSGEVLAHFTGACTWRL